MIDGDPKYRTNATDGWTEAVMASPSICADRLHRRSGKMPQYMWHNRDKMVLLPGYFVCSLFYVLPYGVKKRYDDDYTLPRLQLTHFFPRKKWWKLLPSEAFLQLKSMKMLFPPRLSVLGPAGKAVADS